MKPHKWAKEIKAWADGAEIECRHEVQKGEWEEFDGNWGNVMGWEFRIKPQPKEPQYLYVYKEPKSDAIGAKQQVFITTEKGLYFDAEPIGKIKLEQGDE